MPNPVLGLIGVAAGGVGSAVIGSKAASNAANAQVEASAMGVAEQRAAREEMRRLMEPYLASGNKALGNYMDFMGLGDIGSQQSQISALEDSPIFQSLVQQGEQGILQNASATGGLRGGNTQGALAQFRPAMLNQQIQQQMDRLGGLATMGQNAAAGVGSSGMQSASSIASLLGEAGAARAGSSIASGQAWGNALGNIGGILSGIKF
jgi:hypothetical protein